MDEKDALSTLRDGVKYLFVTRSRSVIAGRLPALADLDIQITATKKEYISQQDEQNANKWLSIEHLCKSVIAGMNLFLELKSGDPDKAWSLLVDAQDHAYCSGMAYELNDGLQEYMIRCLDGIEKVVFPPQTFLSASMIIESHCSICRKPFCECDHLAGEPYMGKLCMRMNPARPTIRHVSIVGNPVDKRCRITHLGNLPKTNLMTLED